MGEVKKRPGLLYLAVETKSRKTNIGTILRCAVAFGCDALCIVGCNSFSTHGAHGSQSHISILHFYYWTDFQDFVKERGCPIYGIANQPDIHSSATSAAVTDFHHSAAFIVGNKNCELSPPQEEIVDHTVFVPFSGRSDVVYYVNIDVKVSICLNYFAMTKDFSESSVEGEKYVVDSSRVRSKTVPHVSSGAVNSDRSNAECAVSAANMFLESDY
mmetsp:Transcript_6242/g.9414  ORF Transcript_6242/g.9414 Transcript_6242/m.9414 type:complete len:215 (+) Transcript_6242:37-681(+)